MVQDGVVLTEPDWSGLRRAMVDNQIRTFDVTDQRVLEAFYLVPRERFLPAQLAPLAYSDAQITLKASGAESRIPLPPLFLARLIQGATVTPASNALVVAGATGYAAAIMARITRHVVALDSDPAFSATAASTLQALGVENAEAVTGPLAQGHAAGAPFDVILVNGAVERNLETLFAQLGPTGCLVAIETLSSSASRRSGKATRYDKINGEISARALFDATVPVLPEFRDPARFVF